VEEGAAPVHGHDFPAFGASVAVNTNLGSP
jgi:hypothetical protein